MFQKLAVYLCLASVAWGGSMAKKAKPADNLTVSTRTGTFIGSLNDTYPNVRQFKNIPFAKPPVGPLRWEPPVPLDSSSEVFDSTTFGPSCPQYITALPSVWAFNITGNLVVSHGQSLTAGWAVQSSAEDCLSIAIWTPAGATPDSKLPVIHFLTGGGDVTGGIEIPTQMPANWVHRSQKHIVVTTNYRVNIFANPNARGLNGTTNLGLRDIRMAVEWVHENIANFGGDPTKMTLWGQSAGSRSTDEYLYAFAKDPIVRASISSSAVAIPGTPPTDPTGSNFTFVAKSLGCDFADAKTELQCMRSISPERIENFVGQYTDNRTLVNPSMPPLAFARQADGELVFSNYTERLSQGHIATIPKIIGTVANEGSALLPYPSSNATVGPNVNAMITATLSTVCASYETSLLRHQIGLTTYRYQWAGNFSNLGGGVPWLGAYHYSDLYMVFGTYLITPGASPEVEVKTSQLMQDFFLGFVENPVGSQAAGWPAYVTSDAEGGKMARFGADGQTFQVINGDVVDGPCHIPGAIYNLYP